MWQFDENMSIQENKDEVALRCSSTKCINLKKYKSIRSEAYLKISLWSQTWCAFSVVFVGRKSPA